jgi:hypothetical protein
MLSWPPKDAPESTTKARFSCRAQNLRSVDVCTPSGRKIAPEAEGRFSCPDPQMNISQLRAAREQLREAREAKEAYLELRLAIRNDIFVRDETGEQILAACGRTIDDVRRDVGELRAMAEQYFKTDILWYRCNILLEAAHANTKM